MRDWFTRECDPIQKIIDGLDIGWGGVQHWAATQLHPAASNLHLDIACGYGTFLAQLGWHFPGMRMIGLNIDFSGPHSLAKPLLEEAGVNAWFVQADARCMPFANDTFDSASCFLGLQDIEIGFGESGVQNTIMDAVRVLRPDGMLILLDEFKHVRFEKFIADLPLLLVAKDERQPDIQWNREVALAAIKLFAHGWVAQMRIPEDDIEALHKAYQVILTHLETEVEQQISKQGYYVPSGPIRMIVARKEGIKK